MKPVYHDAMGEVDPVRLEPFKKLNWKNPQSREEWDDLHSRIRQAKNLAEWRSVLDDKTDRRCAIVHVNNYNREQWLKRVGEHGLHYRDIRYTEPYDGFSHKHFPTTVEDPERITYAVISQDEAVAEQVKAAELEAGRHEMHDIVGKNLGFPKCCREHFNDVWVDDGIIDPMYEITCNTDDIDVLDDEGHHLRVNDPNPGANVLWRYFGFSFITHLPCSWDCEKSIQVARDRYRIMCENGYEDAANALYQWLESPHLWTGLRGIANIRNQHVTAAAGTSSYWKEKRIVWKGEHAPGGEVP